MKTAPRSLKVDSLNQQEAIALRSVAEGTASAYQQKQALFIIVNKFSRAHDVLYIPGSFDETAFLGGRAFVGQQILKYLKLPVGKLDELPETLS